MNTCQTVLRVPVCVRGARSLLSLSPVPVTPLLSLKAKGCEQPWPQTACRKLCLGAGHRRTQGRLLPASKFREEMEMVEGAVSFRGLQTGLGRRSGVGS